MTFQKHMFIKIGLIFLAVLVSTSYYLSLQSGTLIFLNEYSRDVEYTTNFQKTFVKDNTYSHNVSVWELGASKSTDQYLLYLPGNGGLMETMFTELQTNFNVVGVAYPGYHESGSEPTPENTLSAVDTVYNWMITDQNIPSSNITIFGHSLGGSPATYIAGKYNNAKQLVLVNTFSSVQSMCFRSFTVLCGFTGGLFNSAEYAKKVTITIVVFAYEGDEVIPFVEGEKLYTYFINTQKKEFVVMDRYDHNLPDFIQIFSKIT
jgi:uncharacterized protein